MTNSLPHSTIARDDSLYEAFPDICLLPSGKLLCIYRESDAHVAGNARIMLIESDDRGHSWVNARPLDVPLSFTQHRRVWNGPRITRLPDGRLVAISDASVYPDEADSCLWPENRRCFQNFLWLSHDDGQTWTERRQTDIEGLCPDKVLALDDTHWLIAIARFSTRFPGAFRVSVAHSVDGGRTWPAAVLAAEQDGYQHDEASVVRLTDGRLLCVMRENVHTTRPSHYVLSADDGYTWSTPRRAPFFGDRPAAGLLQSGKLLVTYRNVEPAPGEVKLKVGRNPGTWAWCGDLSGLAGTGGESLFLELEHDACGWHGDYGYSGWVQFDDGEIFCVYHHRDAAPNSYIRGCRFREEDFGG